jgi:hypothetical protein
MAWRMLTGIQGRYRQCVPSFVVSCRASSRHNWVPPRTIGIADRLLINFLPRAKIFKCPRGNYYILSG